MKQIISRAIFTIFLICMFTGLTAEDYANTDDVNQPVLTQNIEKIYVSPSQVLITSKGIFIDLENVEGLLAVESVSCDEAGIYIIMSNPSCGHTRACNACGGCSPSNKCSFRCKCSRRP